MERVATLRIVQQKRQAMLIFGCRNLARTQLFINMVQGRGGVEEALEMAAGLSTHLAEIALRCCSIFPKTAIKISLPINDSFSRQICNEVR